MVEDNKDGIVSTVRRVMAKRKVDQAMGEPSPGSGSSQIGRHIMQRHKFPRLISLISSDPGSVVVILNDDVQQSKGYQGASNQPIVPVTTLF